FFSFFFQAEDGIRDLTVTGVQTCALPISMGHPDRFTLQLLTTVLGGGMSSRLFTEVRERRGLAYYVFSTNASYLDAGSLYAQARSEERRVGKECRDRRCGGD